MSTGKWVQYVIELSPYGRYFHFTCPITGARLTEDIDEAEVFTTLDGAVATADRLNEMITSDAVATVVEVQRRRKKHEEVDPS